MARNRKVKPLSMGDRVCPSCGKEPVPIREWSILFKMCNDCVDIEVDKVRVEMEAAGEKDGPAERQEFILRRSYNR